jgi:[acyl-carrier-protein] S-malonyltransferase
MKIALLFPGYGSQYVGMGKELYDEYRIVQEYFEEASNCLNVNFVKLCFASSDAELAKMVNAYTALFLMGSATYALLKEHGMEPDVVTGYNNGESAALFAAGCFSFPDGLYLLNKFCSFYQEIVDGMDVDLIHITGVTTEVVENACEQVNSKDDKAFIALYNSLTDHLVAGSRDQLSQIRDIIDGSGTVEYVGVEAGLHCELVNPVVEQFKMYLEKVDFKDLRIPLVSSIDGEMVTQGADTKERFIRHINSPLMFNAALAALADYDCIVIANPGNVLDEMVKQQYPEKFVISIAKKEDIDTLKEMVKKEYEEIGFTDGN